MTNDGRERVALYARYSSDLQSRSSAQDQIDLLQRIVEVRGGRVVAAFRDEGLSGATLSTRSQALALMEAARRREFDVVMCEALDRLSRDLEDTARIFKHLTFAGVRLETLSEGRISELHVGLTGSMNQLHLAELARKTRRGLMARVAAGFSAGGRCYGYALRERGILELDPAQAETVRRIFNDYADGLSASAICDALNAQGEAAPRGPAWRNTTLLGDPRVGDGVLSQELYIGQRVFNRRRFSKHPETGRRSSVTNPPDQWIRRPVPELRIVDDELWARVQRRRSELGGARVRERRPKRLLSGLMICAACGETMILTGGRYACRARQERRGCSNVRTIDARKLEIRLLDDLQDQLTPPSAAGEDPRPLREGGGHQELTEVEARLSRLRLLFVGGDIDLDRLRIDAAPLQARRLRLLKQGTRVSGASANRAVVITRIVQARAQIAAGVGIAELTSVRLLIKRVVFTAAPGHGSYSLDITLTAAFAKVATDG